MTMSQTTPDAPADDTVDDIRSPDQDGRPVRAPGLATWLWD